MNKPLVEVVHELVQQAVSPGDCVIDATVGNGHDTQMLAEAVFPGGSVHAFDVQDLAIEQARSQLPQQHQPLVTFHHASHCELQPRLPEQRRGEVTAVLFNLGYLPGGDKTITTRPETTLKALEAALQVLRPGGLLSVLAYIGHPGGREEADAVADWYAQEKRCEHEEIRGHSERSPRLFVGWRR